MSDLELRNCHLDCCRQAESLLSPAPPLTLISPEGVIIRSLSCLQTSCASPAPGARVPALGLAVEGPARSSVTISWQLWLRAQCPVPRPPSGLSHLYVTALTLPASSFAILHHVGKSHPLPGGSLPISTLFFVHLASPLWPRNTQKNVPLHSLIHSPFTPHFPRFPELSSAPSTKMAWTCAHPCPGGEMANRELSEEDEAVSSLKASGKASWRKGH